MRILHTHENHFEVMTMKIIATKKKHVVNKFLLGHHEGNCVLIVRINSTQYKNDFMHECHHIKSECQR